MKVELMRYESSNKGKIVGKIEIDLVPFLEAGGQVIRVEKSMESGRSVPPVLISEWRIERINAEKENAGDFEDDDTDSELTSRSDKWDETDTGDSSQDNPWRVIDTVKSGVKKKDSKTPSKTGKKEEKTENEPQDPPKPVEVESSEKHRKHRHDRKPLNSDIDSSDNSASNLGEKVPHRRRVSSTEKEPDLVQLEQNSMKRINLLN